MVMSLESRGQIDRFTEDGQPILLVPADTWLTGAAELGPIVSKNDA